MRIRGEMKETLLEAVRMELLARMIDMLPLSMYRCRRRLLSTACSCCSPRLASPRHASPARGSQRFNHGLLKRLLSGRAPVRLCGCVWVSVCVCVRLRVCLRLRVFVFV